MIVGTAEGRVIGFLSLSIGDQLHHAGKIATVEELVLSFDQRGKGYGTMLLNRALAIARENRCKGIELTSNFSRTDAHAFYLRNGFKKSSFKFKKDLP